MPDQWRTGGRIAAAGRSLAAVHRARLIPGRGLPARLFAPLDNGIILPPASFPSHARTPNRVTVTIEETRDGGQEE